MNKNIVINFTTYFSNYYLYYKKQIKSKKTLKLIIIKRDETKT